MTKPDELKPPIMILSSGRTGTNMLLKLLRLHPDVAAWGEIRPIWSYGDPGREHDVFDASDATPRVVRYIRKRFLRHQRRHGHRRVVDKTPATLLRIDFVRAIFPEAKFIYLVRNPLSFVNSTDRQWKRLPTRRNVWIRVAITPWSQWPAGIAALGRAIVQKLVRKKRFVQPRGVRYPGMVEDLRTMSPTQVMAKQWAECSRLAEAELAKLEPGLVVRVRYEDFVADPRTWFRRICEHCDLPVTDALLDQVAAAVHVDRVDKWRQFDQQALRCCIPLMADEMRRQGYAIPDQLRPDAEHVAADAPEEPR
ncbi:MAG: sulfotransferase [Phycisphaeraceae bacterium]